MSLNWGCRFGDGLGKRRELQGAVLSAPRSHHSLASCSMRVCDLHAAPVLDPTYAAQPVPGEPRRPPAGLPPAAYSHSSARTALREIFSLQHLSRKIQSQNSDLPLSRPSN